MDYPPGNHMAELQPLQDFSVLPSPSQTYWVGIGSSPQEGGGGLPIPQGEFGVFRGMSPYVGSPIYTHQPTATNSNGYFIQLQNGQLLFFGGDPGEGIYDFQWSTSAVSDDAKDYWYVADNGVIEIVNPVNGQSFNPFKIAGDPVTEFQVTGVSYNLSQATIQSVTLDTLFQETLTNSTGTQQSSEIDNTWSITRQYSFSITSGIKVTVKVSGDVSLPLVANGKVEVDAEADISVTFGVTETYQEQWTIKQPVVVPPDSTVTATVTISAAQFTLPYTVTGNYVYQSGNTAPVSVSGTFSGINGYDFQVALQNGGPTGQVTIIQGPATGTIVKA
jgi:Clostridium epsilon toxin ETX/Bacillus mosquitocidal toxin MTX2